MLRTLVNPGWYVRRYTATISFQRFEFLVLFYIQISTGLGSHESLWSLLYPGASHSRRSTGSDFLRSLLNPWLGKRLKCLFLRLTVSPDSDLPSKHHGKLDLAFLLPLLKRTGTSPTDFNPSQNLRPGDLNTHPSLVF